MDWFLYDKDFRHERVKYEIYIEKLTWNVWNVLNTFIQRSERYMKALCIQLIESSIPDRLEK